MTDFEITGLSVLPAPIIMKRGARVLATFDVKARGFRFEVWRLYHIEGKGWGWWTPNPKVMFPREMRGPVKVAARAAYEAQSAP